MKTIVIRVDASTQIGTGHVIRSLTLADELKAKGTHVSFVCCEEEGNLIHLIKNKGYQVFSLGKKFNFENDIQQTREILKQNKIKPDWLIVDHYKIDRSWEISLKHYIKKIMVIDDLANRDHDCDLLLDQNLILQENRYEHLVPKQCIQLIGPHYALLKKQFVQERADLVRKYEEVKNILIFVGGSDPHNVTSKALSACLTLEEQGDIQINLIIGVSNPHKQEIELLAKQNSQVKCYYNVDNMAYLMAQADLSIGSGGVTSWERCCLGLPTIALIIADNQKDIVIALEKKEILINLGWYEQVQDKEIREALIFLINNKDQRKKMGMNGMNLVDGKGVERVIKQL